MCYSLGPMEVTVSESLFGRRYKLVACTIRDETKHIFRSIDTLEIGTGKDEQDCGNGFSAQTKCSGY